MENIGPSRVSVGGADRHGRVRVGSTMTPPDEARGPDPLIAAWRAHTDRFADPSIPKSETPIRDAFAAGWDARAALPAPVAGGDEALRAGLDKHEAELHRLITDHSAAELRANHYKTPWYELSLGFLMTELYAHVAKLNEDGTWEHAADVANLAAMFADRHAALSSRVPGERSDPA